MTTSPPPVLKILRTLTHLLRPTGKHSPALPPAAAVNVAAWATGATTASVTWQAGAGGGLPVAYIVTWTTGTTSSPVLSATRNGDARTFDLSGLLQRARYLVTVTAVNAAGTRSPVSSVELVMDSTAVGVPGAPQVVTALSSSSSTAVLSWRVPLTDGGSPITGYRVGRNGFDSGGAGDFSIVISPDPVAGLGLGKEFTLLLPSTGYNPWVEAINAFGTGPRVTVAVTTRAQTEDPNADKEVMPFLSFDRTIPWKDGVKLAVIHEMDGYHNYDNLSFPLILQGTIATDADRTTKATGLVLADTGKFWRSLDTGKCWVWTWTLTATANSGAFVDYGPLPAYTVVGKPYDNPKAYENKHYKPMPAGVGRDAELAAGGRWRDWAPGDPRRNNDQNVYAVENALKRIRDASEAGVNAYALRMAELPSQGPSWKRGLYFLAAVERFNAEQAAAGKLARFYWCVSLDGQAPSMAAVLNTDGTINHEQSAVVLADEMLKLKGRPGWLKIDGKDVILPFGVNLKGTVAQRRLFISTFKNRMAAGGMPMHFVGGLLADWRNFFEPVVSASVSWKGVVDALNDWGPADPTSALSTSVRVRAMASAVFDLLNLPVWMTIRPVDYRPYSNGDVTWHEGGGFDTLKNTFFSAMGKGGFLPFFGVHYVTGNDFAEGSEMEVTVKKGHTIFDVCQYWLEEFRTGVKPTIVRDVIHVAHRNQFKNDPTYPMTFTGASTAGQTTPIYQQSVFAVEKAQNSTPIRNDVHTMVDLKAAGNVRCSINGVEQTPSVGTTAGAANTRHEVRWRAKPGVVRVWIERGGVTVQDYVSPEKISQTQKYEDLTYFMGTSARSGVAPPPPPPSSGDAPGVPTLVTTSAVDNDEATINWGPPTTTGSSPITGYRVSREGTDRGGAGAWNVTLPATDRSKVFTNLLASTSYPLSVAAVNLQGIGPAVTLTITTAADPVVVGVTLPPTGASVKTRLVGVNGWVSAGHGGYPSTRGPVTLPNVTGARLYLATDQAMTQNLTRTALVPMNDAAYTRHQHGRTSGTWYFKVATVQSGVEKIDSFTKPGRIVITPPGQHTFTWHGGSCAGFDGGSAFTKAAEANDASMFFNGDAVYDNRTPFPMSDYYWYGNRFLCRPSVQADLSWTKSSMTGSDHDSLENDNTGGDQPARWASWNTMIRKMWPNDYLPLTLDAKGMPTVGAQHSWDEGPVRFIALDTRSMRSAWRDADSASKTYLGATQEAWFRNLLETMPGNMLAFVICDNSFFGSDSGPVDAWRGYPTARRRFAATIGEILGTTNPRMVYAAGDAHALRYDNGSKNPTATKFAQCHAAPWWTATANGTSQAAADSHWSGGGYPTSSMDTSVPYQQYGRWAVTRTATQLTMVFRGHDSTGAVVFGPHTKTWQL